MRAVSPSQVRSSSPGTAVRSEEHTSELQSQSNLVCRLLLEKKKHVWLYALRFCQRNLFVSVGYLCHDLLVSPHSYLTVLIYLHANILSVAEAFSLTSQDERG